MTEPSEKPRHVYPIDRFLHANEARLTSGLSPSSASAAYLDWTAHLANSPGKHGELFEKAFRMSLTFGAYVGDLLSDKKDAPCIEPLPPDHRFRGED
jgi:poly[(R)-3-hydroxyalkanoate] polymerase subunit PhaC